MVYVIIKPNVNKYISYHFISYHISPGYMSTNTAFLTYMPNKTLLSGSNKFLLWGSNKFLLWGSNKFLLLGSNKLLLWGSNKFLLSGSNKFLLWGSNKFLLLGSNKFLLWSSNKFLLWVETNSLCIVFFTVLTCDKQLCKQVCVDEAKSAFALKIKEVMHIEWGNIMYNKELYNSGITV